MPDMNTKLCTLDRRRFLRGVGGFALALPAFETFAGIAGAAEKPANPRRLACVYLPNGVPMPLEDDPAYEDWSWFPHGAGEDFTFSKCLDPLEPLRDELTVLSGMSHPAARNTHGHHNADQFLTGAAIGGRGDYKNSISLDQVYAAHIARADSHLVPSHVDRRGHGAAAEGAHDLVWTPTAAPSRRRTSRNGSSTGCS